MTVPVFEPDVEPDGTAPDGAGDPGLYVVAGFGVAAGAAPPARGVYVVPDDGAGRPLELGDAFAGEFGAGRGVYDVPDDGAGRPLEFGDVFGVGRCVELAGGFAGRGVSVRSGGLYRGCCGASRGSFLGGGVWAGADRCGGGAGAALGAGAGVFV